MPDRIICNSSAVRNRFTKAKIDARIKTILNGVGLREFDSEVNGGVIRKEFNIGEDELIIGTVGRIDPGKGYEYFLESARIVLQDFKNIRFLVVGRAFNNPSLEKSLYETSKLAIE